jgi:membrane protease YdiL (CAAX protease family)
MYPALKQRFGVWRALSLVSLLFALSHAHLPSLLPLFILALGLGLAYEFTGSLLVPTGMHALFNALMVVKLIFDRAHP